MTRIDSRTLVSSVGKGSWPWSSGTGSSGHPISGRSVFSHQLSLRFGKGMQILMKNIHRKIRSKSDRKMFRQMNAQIVMIGRLKLQIQPTVNEPPPDDLPSSRSFGLPEEQVLQRRRQLEGDVRLERAQQVAVGDVGERDLDRRRAASLRTTER